MLGTVAVPCPIATPSPARPKPTNPIPAAAPHGSLRALQRKPAAAWLGVGVDFFDDEVRPHVLVARVGGMRLWPVAELQRAQRTGKPSSIALSIASSNAQGKNSSWSESVCKANRTGDFKSGAVN